MSADAKPLTTAEVLAWFDPCCRCDHSRLLATTRALETAQTALTIATSRANVEAEARTGYLALMGGFHEHLGLMIQYLEEETSQGDGVAEEHHDGYAAAKSLVERTKGLEGLWERAQIEVHEIKRERDDALHTFRCVWETEQFREMEARAEKAEKARDLAKSFVGELVRERDTARFDRDAERAHADRLEKELIGVHKALIDVHDALHRECDGTANLPDEIRALRSDRDAALARRDEVISDLDRIQGQVGPELARLRALVAELAAALAGLERRFLDPAKNEPGGPCWCYTGRRLALLGHEDECKFARAAMAKAKGATT